MIVENSSNTVTKTQSERIRLSRIALAIVLAIVVFVLVPAESLDSAVQVIAGLSDSGRAVVAPTPISPVISLCILMFKLIFPIAFIH